MSFIEAIEKKLGKTIEKNMLPIQPGDVPATFADVDALVKNLGYKPETDIQTGIDNFIDWYMEFFQINKNGVNNNE
jgi:UDP-glucuronate 4-epimerase